MTDEKIKSAEPLAPREQTAQAKRFLDTAEERAIVLGKLRTDEEARLAAEIDKLRD